MGGRALSQIKNNRGGASEASVATLQTGDVDGSSRYMYVCIRASSPWANYSRTCANGAESAIFEIYFYRERKLWKKKISCSGVGLEPGSDALQTTAFATEPMGLWQL